MWTRCRNPYQFTDSPKRNTTVRTLFSYLFRQRDGIHEHAEEVLVTLQARNHFRLSGAVCFFLVVVSDLSEVCYPSLQYTFGVHVQYSLKGSSEEPSSAQKTPEKSPKSPGVITTPKVVIFK